MASTLTLSDAVWARLQDLPEIATYDGLVPKTPASEQYAVFYPGGGTANITRLSDLGSQLAWGCFIVCVGRTRQQAANVADKIRARMQGWRPDANAATSPLREVPLDAPVIRDDSVRADVRFSLTLRYTVTTTRS